ncbi:UNVERIFIED_CONTAM: riboflavin kinase/FMN adenylyltransferase [Acetivibrio alkalicellulosi]
MKIISGSNLQCKSMKQTGVGLGNFDGLHIGHMTLINMLINECTLNSLESLIYTFTKHPENIIRKKLFTPLITTVNQKVELLSQTSLDYICFEEFDENYSRIKPEVFVKEILVERLKMKVAVAGYNYRFGYKGEGNVEMLKELGKRLDFRVVVVPQVKIEDEIVSSTIIRKYIKKGNMDNVLALLGRYYCIEGKVKEGKKIGRKLGFPTANIYPEGHIIIPGDGVYITKTTVADQSYVSVTNVGNNPTFPGENKKSIETYILDFENDFYGVDIKVFFIKKIRGEKTFKNSEQLVAQIQKDVITVREYFGSDLCR